jgi:hypothetical protein
MLTLNEGLTYREFLRHYPSGEVYVLETDQPTGYDAANIVGVFGPVYHRDINNETLESVPTRDHPEDSAWAYEETWVPV